MARGKCATSLSNYTSVRVVVNEGERCIGIALMGKALMRILRTPNAPSSEYFSTLQILRATSRMFNNVKGRCFQISEGLLACHQQSSLSSLTSQSLR